MAAANTILPHLKPYFPWQLAVGAVIVAGCVAASVVAAVLTREREEASPTVLPETTPEGTKTEERNE